MLLFQTPSSPGLPYVHSIPAVGERDQGMYTCVARNVVGRSHAAAYLQVNSAINTRISRSVETLLPSSEFGVHFNFYGCLLNYTTAIQLVFIYIFGKREL